MTLSDPPQRIGVEWPTLLVAVATYGLWAGSTLLWGVFAPLSIVLTGWFIAQFSSLQHEALHGHPFASKRLNAALVFPALTLIVCYTFFGLDALGDELEEPFGREVNDLPLDAMARQLERELLAAAGRAELPPALEAQGNLLL